MEMVYCAQSRMMTENGMIKRSASWSLSKIDDGDDDDDNTRTVSSD
jgi:hypothetical protein